jgi:hypothetical protein
MKKDQRACLYMTLYTYHVLTVFIIYMFMVVSYSLFLVSCIWKTGPNGLELSYPKDVSDSFPIPPPYSKLHYCIAAEHVITNAKYRTFAWSASSRKRTKDSKLDVYICA